MDYVIFECSRALDLLAQYGEAFGVVVPVQRKHRFNERRHTVAVEHSAAIPGFAFIPATAAPALRRAAPSAYSLRQLRTPHGFSCTVSKADLAGLQERLDREYSNGYTFNLGDKVKVHFHPTIKSGSEGEIVKFRTNGNARIRLSNGHSYVEVVQMLLSKV